MRPAPSGRKPVPSDVDWTDAIERVLAEPELVRPVFQPIVDLERGVATGYEMLARFVSPIKAPPPIWLQQAERRDVGTRLEAMLVEIGLDAMSSVPENCFLTINLSPTALGSEAVAEVLDNRTSLEGVVIEVTEQDMVEDYGELEFVLRTLRSAGAAIAVDDAGSGYASLQHIVALRPQFVKLDRTLVTGLDHDEAKLAVIESLGTFSSRIDAWMVAEGIENADEMAALQRLRVPLAQGYWLGVPASAMQPVADDQRDEIRSGRHLSLANAGIAALVERMPAAALSAGGEAIAQMFAADLDLAHVTVVDGSKRPVAIVPREGFFGGGARERTPMTVQMAESLAAVARRSVTRAFAERFDPVVACDPRGRYVGIVRIERLMDGLAALLEIQSEITDQPEPS